MTDLVVFKLGATPNDPVVWGAFAMGAAGEAGRVGDVAALAAIADRIPADARLVAVLPGEQVAAREIPAPPKQAAKLYAAAAYILEDDLAEPIDDLHIVVSQGAARSACAISKRLLAEWLAALDGTGIAINELTVDFACIGGGAERCVLVIDGGRLIASRGAAGFSAELDLAGAVAPAFIEASGDSAIIAYADDGLAGQWTVRPIERRAMAHEIDLLTLFGAELSAKPAPVNLLTGAFRRRSARSFNVAPYKRPAILAAGLAAALLVSVIAGGVRDARVASAYETSAQAMHKAAFPAYASADIRGHARRVLAEGIKAASFLEMAQRLSATLEAQDGVAIDRIRYDAARGQFAFNIRSNSDAGIETFRAALDANGLIASDSGGYRRSGEAWVGEMSARAK